jgi:hypothetical protein
VLAHILESAAMELLVKGLRAGLIQVLRAAVHPAVAVQVLKVLISLLLPQPAQPVVRVWLPVIRAVLLIMQVAVAVADILLQAVQEVVVAVVMAEVARGHLASPEP